MEHMLKLARIQTLLNNLIIDLQYHAEGVLDPERQVLLDMVSILEESRDRLNEAEILGKIIWKEEAWTHVW